ncbi:MAG: CARDB domain-containing protein, partial [Pseudomonadota bacterium]
EAGRVITGVGDDRLRVRARTDYEDLDYLTRNPGELDRITVNSPPNGALPSDTPNVAANPSEGPLSADSLFDWISRRRNVERIASSERLIQNVEDPAPLLRDGRWQWCGRINGPHNYYNWVPNDNHWTLRGQSGGNWNTLVDDNPSGASWLIGTFTSNGEPIRNRQPDANDGDNNMGVVSSQQLQDGGYGGTWNSFGANGLNFTWYSGSTCTRITEVDTFVNPAIANDNAQHLKSLTHEFGHALGQSTNGAGGHEDEMFAIMFAGTFQQPPNYSSVWYGRMDDMAGVRDFLNTSNSNYPGTFVQETWVDMATWSQTHNNWGSAGSLIMTDANTYSGRRGDSFTIRGLQVENRGNLPATNVNLRFYLSSNTTITGSDYLAGSAIWDTFSPQGRWSNGSWTVSIPGNVPAGTYSIGWILSLDQTERSAANNTAIMRRSNTFNFTERQFTVIGQPDLTVNSVSLSPTSALQGETVMITSSVSNIGDATSPSTIVRFYRSSNSTISTADTALGQTVLGGLVAGGTTTRSYSAIMSVPGNWYLGACVEQVPFEDNVFNLCSPGVFIQVQAVDELFEDRFGLP